MKLQDTALVKYALLRRLRERTALIGIVGLEYVAPPLALCFAEIEYRAIRLDIDEAKVEEALNAGGGYSRHIPGGRKESARGDARSDARGAPAN